MADGKQVPQGLYYTKDHEWVRVEGDAAVVGITDHAQHALGEVTYVDPPVPGKRVEQFKEMGAVESAKAAADICAPLSGTVAEVNTALEDAPETVNRDPYGDGWICKLRGVSTSELAALLTPHQYRQLLEQDAK
jgi:glycine cleavage system H protein